ncbi:MAG TPA: glycogen synthase, partial [Gammaproteobacteria bacterium]|nr:glycogen synthase [Gammaproteobacteria bacterium]
AYQGLFPKELFKKLKLPAEWWSWHLLEFHEQLSFIKGGLVFADWITTVSPTYAREIRTPEFGCGLEGLLQQRSDRLSGILNGVDYEVWSPEQDFLLPRSYDFGHLDRKADNKRALQQAFGLVPDPDVPLFGHVGRLVEQKGVDLILALVEELKQRRLQLVVLGTGQPKLERALRAAHGRHADWLGVRIEYDERLSHLVEGGSDAFLMPSRFEPCGLNQLYSLRYGTPPVVRRTGGLADSVVDANGPNLYDHSATGFVFEQALPEQLLTAIDRALNLYAHPRIWRDIVRTGMQQDFSWERSASRYLELYQRLLALPADQRQSPDAGILRELSDTA